MPELNAAPRRDNRFPPAPFVAHFGFLRINQSLVPLFVSHPASRPVFLPLKPASLRPCSASPRRLTLSLPRSPVLSPSPLALMTPRTCTRTWRSPPFVPCWSFNHRVAPWVAGKAHSETRTCPLHVQHRDKPLERRPALLESSRRPCPPVCPLYVTSRGARLESHLPLALPAKSPLPTRRSTSLRAPISPSPISPARPPLPSARDLILSTQLHDPKLPLGILAPSVPDFLIGQVSRHTAPSASRPSPADFSNQPTIPRSSPSFSFLATPSSSFSPRHSPVAPSIMYECHVALLVSSHYLFLFFCEFPAAWAREARRGKWIAHHPPTPFSPNTKFAMRWPFSVAFIVATAQQRRVGIDVCSRVNPDLLYQSI